MSFFRKLQIKIRNRWNDFNFKKTFLLILFWLSIGSFFIAGFIDGIVNEIAYTDVTGFRYMGPVYLVCSVIPIASLILGIHYRKKGYLCKKNIIGGAIMTFFMLMFTLMGFTSYYTFKDNYSVDYSYVNDLEKVINFEFPDNGKIIVDSNFNFDYGDYTIISISNVIFNNDNEINEFNDKIKNSDMWTEQNSSYLKMLEPDFFVQGDDDNELYHMVYIKDLNTYNTVPTVSGVYHTYYFKYSMSESKLTIYEYNLEFTV